MMNANPQPPAQMRALVNADGSTQYRLVELPMADRLGDELRELLQAAWTEARPAWLPEQCAPDVNMLRAAEQAGALFTVCVYATDDRLIGFAAAHVYRECFTSVPICDGLALYIEPEHRRAVLTEALLDTVADAARARGAALMQWFAGPGASLDAYLRPTACFRHASTVYAAHLTT